MTNTTGLWDPPTMEEWMFVLRNIFGMIHTFDDIDTALEAYEEERRLFQYCRLYNVITGEVIADSYCETWEGCV